MVGKYHNHKLQTNPGHRVDEPHSNHETPEPPPENGQQHKPPGRLNAFNWYQIFVLDSAGVEVQERFSSHVSLLTIAIYHKEKHSNQLTHYDETNNRAYDSQQS